MGVYKSYKPSGVDWIGEIPKDWNLKRIKYLFKSIVEKSIDGSEELLSVSEKKGIIPRRELRDENEELTRSESLEGYLKVDKDDLVNNIMLMWKRGLGVSNYKGIVSPSYSVFRLNKPNIPSYWNYLLRTDLYVTEFRRNSTGVIDSRLRLYDDSFGDIFSILPPVNEQLKIVQFLDNKTELIDTLISTKERKISLLNEQRNTLINHIVTKGLNSNVKMKNSGVEWIGMIPEHWVIKKLKWLCDTNSNQISEENLNGIELIHYSIPNVQEFGIGILENGSDIDSSKLVVKGGEILFSKLNPRKGTTCIVKSNKDYLIVCSGEFISLIPHFDNIRYIHFLISNQSFIEYIDSMVESVTRSHQRVRPEKFLSSFITIPPIKEQIEIIEYLDTKLKDIDDLVKLEQKKIDLLKEYRQSLISEVVTGKVKVTT
jgi:type I restriction enzyme S subunit